MNQHIEKKFSLVVEENQTQYQIEAWGSPPNFVEQNHSAQQSAQWLQEQYLHLQIKMLKQVHEDILIEIPFENNDAFVWAKADAVFSRQRQVVCAVRTADCIPILLWTFEQPLCVAVHAGWRGLQQNILPKTIYQLKQKFSIKNWHVFVGAHIHCQTYPVQKDVYSLFDLQDSLPTPQPQTRLLNTSQILKKQLLEAQVLEQNIIWQNENCFDSNHWFSHRAKQGGRNIFFIYIL